ncbi:hypothetical protein [Streptomyces longispororuber]|uniref:hypothetical protein n=1 Tax=Streptomyces longispororuber TaxID=68230 RepID=UPI00210BB396|nr:hypothetical protein [Streptomyces longispororuber]MCQ4210733.1 hypothetical protein [Streptomyces longispororuber]
MRAHFRPSHRELRGGGSGAVRRVFATLEYGELAQAADATGGVVYRLFPDDVDAATWTRCRGSRG